MPTIGTTGPGAVPLRRGDGRESITLSAGSGIPFRAGVSVLARVVGQAADGQTLLRVRGSEFPVPTTKQLPIGSLVWLRMATPAEFPGSKTTMALYPPSPLPSGFAARLLLSLGMGQDASGIAAAEAWLSRGLVPDASGLARVRRAVAAGIPGEERERAAMACRLEAKGLGATPEAVDRLLAIESGRDSEGRSDEDFRRADGGDDAHDSLLTELAAMLALLCSRRDGDFALLGLFNQLHASEPDVLVPFSFQLGSIAFKGSFRLHLKRMSRVPASMEGRFTVFPEGSSPEGGTLWGFSLTVRAGAANLLRIQPPHDGRVRDWLRLGTSLAASGCELMVMESERGIPFIPGVDTSA